MLTKIFYHILGLLVAFCLLFAVLITVTETLLYRVDGYFAKEYQKYAVTERVDMRLSDLLSVTDEMMDYLEGRQGKSECGSRHRRRAEGIFQCQGKTPHAGCTGAVFAGAGTAQRGGICRRFGGGVSLFEKKTGGTS